MTWHCIAWLLCAGLTARAESLFANFMRTPTSCWDAAGVDTVPDLPIALTKAEVVRYNDSIIVVGGQDDKYAIQDVVWVYDLGSNIWRASTSGLNYPRVGHSLAIRDDMLYVLGGDDGINELGVNVTEVCDLKVFPLEFRIKEKMELPEYLMDFGTALVPSDQGDQLVIFGGVMEKKEVVNRSYVYHFDSNHWTPGHALPYKASNFGYVQDEKEVVIFGGWNGKHELCNVIRFSLVTNSVRYHPKLQFCVRNSAAVLHRDGKRIHVVGGERWKSQGRDVIQLMTVLDTATNEYTSIVSLQTPLTNAMATHVNGSLVILGGESNVGGSTLADVHTWHDPHNECLSFLNAAWVTLFVYIFGTIGVVASLHVFMRVKAAWERSRQRRGGRYTTVQ